MDGRPSAPVAAASPHVQQAAQHQQQRVAATATPAVLSMRILVFTAIRVEVLANISRLITIAQVRQSFYL